ncbi:ABC transporter permease [Limosilactobacillus caecicola]|uniref:ABC transporter permease n=1 Tax=Limosilactobacillus caecicola TaxID=2941332 RepID=UPI00203EF4BF|nr:ABC transporter permease [Limosilactobacillus caecicola]
MIKYWNENYPVMLQDVQQHLEMVFTALGIAMVITIVLILIFMHQRKWLNGLVYFFSLLYSVPSFALFVLLLPISGLGMKTAIITLTIYCEYVLLRTFITGIQEIDPSLIEVARGMGMTNRQIFFKVQLPLAVPAIFSGLQVALASMIGIATIAATINAGGLGQLLFEGLQTQQVVPLLWGTLLAVGLTLVCAAVLKFVEYLLSHRWKSALTA